MFHVMIDKTGGYRSRLDDIKYVFEFLEELPAKLELMPVSSPFILPYYNGVIPEDCGISAFIFLKGGHITFHSFSYHEALFIDIASPTPINIEEAEKLIQMSFPSQSTSLYFSNRSQRKFSQNFPSVDEKKDFGPHLMLDFPNFKQTPVLDEIYSFLDTLPEKIEMTPIIRPYIIKTVDKDSIWYSGLTMIAESHISCHYDPIKESIHVDIFSCRFFDLEKVLKIMDKTMFGPEGVRFFTSRGALFKDYKEKTNVSRESVRNWTKSAYKK